MLPLGSFAAGPQSQSLGTRSAPSIAGNKVDLRKVFHKSQLQVPIIKYGPLGIKQ